MRKPLFGIVTGLLGITVIFNIIAWNSETFCDWYVDNVFPLWGPLYGTFTELTERSVGEMMIVFATILLLCTVVFSLLAVIFYLLKRGNGFRRFYAKFITVLIPSLAVVSFVMTLNCFVLYHCSTFREKYLNSYLLGEREYTVEELSELRDMVVKEANMLASQMERDACGRLVYNKDMKKTAVLSMMKLGRYYPQLSGYYSTPKALTASEFFSQQYMQGYYFPFSMEANYNDVMYVINKPFTMCHELAHTKGFIYEDEANFIGYLACVNSDDPFFKYSGYLSVYNYIEKDFRKSINNDVSIISEHEKVSELVKKDNVFLTPETWEIVEKKAVLKTETVKKASNTFTEKTLKINGVENGMASYCDVVGLLLDYYDYYEVTSL
ncbi:MAG: DUF3810 domain-containing protein [Lachnospiraceae bacterium]|nr:DUF3810 domain-containing protein [Lachnospiraceae bacterium]